MDYSRPNHIPTAAEQEADKRLELRGLIAFAVLTVVATIFMPASLIAGIFGMNFRQMPWLELPSGFYFATGLMMIIATIMLALFWHRR